MENSLTLSHTPSLSWLETMNLKLVNNDIQGMIQILPPWKHTSSYVELKEYQQRGGR